MGKCCALFRIFLYKILKEYKFSWVFRFCFLVLIPIALICTYLKISHYQEIKNIEFDPLDAVSALQSGTNSKVDR